MQSLKALVGLFIGANVQSVHALRPMVIYGGDDRVEYFEVADPAWRLRAESTVALIRSSSLDPQGPITNIRLTSYGQSMGLCSSEPFYAQETAAFCSGFLVSPDTVVTAGHCARTQALCDSIKFVFGFRLNAPGDQPRAIPSENVYSCALLAQSKVSMSGEDFAVIKLDRAVSGARPLDLRRQGQPNVGDHLVVMGHPSGLPLKIAAGAQVRQVLPEHFVGNLDTYGGNSGSAVFNGVTGEVEGILVRGEMDFVYSNGCRISKVCEDGSCRGEDVTRIERVLPFL